MRPGDLVRYRGEYTIYRIQFADEGRFVNIIGPVDEDGIYIHDSPRELKINHIEDKRVLIQHRIVIQEMELP